MIVHIPPCFRRQ